MKMTAVVLEGQAMHSDWQTLTTLSEVKLVNPRPRSAARVSPTVGENGNECFLGIRFYLEQRRDSGDGAGVNCERAHQGACRPRDRNVLMYVFTLMTEEEKTGGRPFWGNDGDVLFLKHSSELWC